jgi:hypothetical protein
MKNDDVQKTLHSAVKSLDKVIARNTDEWILAKLVAVRSALYVLRLASESSNGIPGLRGLGLKEGYALATRINEKMEGDTGDSRILAFHIDHKSILKSVVL